MLLDNLHLFLRIVENGGLAAAGRELGLAPATVTERLAVLEVHYNARLLTRTTRSFSLTDQGRRLVTGARRILAEAEEIEARIKLGVNKVSGSIRLSTPVDLGRNQIVPLIDAFMAQHREVSIDLTLTDGRVNLVGQGVDLAVRYGDLADPSGLDIQGRGAATNLPSSKQSNFQRWRIGSALVPGGIWHRDEIGMRRTGRYQGWSFGGFTRIICARSYQPANYLPRRCGPTKACSCVDRTSGRRVMKYGPLGRYVD